MEQTVISIAVIYFTSLQADISVDRLLMKGDERMFASGSGIT